MGGSGWASRANCSPAPVTLCCESESADRVCEWKCECKHSGSNSTNTWNTHARDEHERYEREANLDRAQHHRRRRLSRLISRSATLALVQGPLGVLWVGSHNSQFSIPQKNRFRYCALLYKTSFKNSYVYCHKIPPPLLGRPPTCASLCLSEVHSPRSSSSVLLPLFQLHVSSSNMLK